MGDEGGDGPPSDVKAGGAAAVGDAFGRMLTGQFRPLEIAMTEGIQAVRRDQSAVLEKIIALTGELDRLDRLLQPSQVAEVTKALDSLTSRLLNVQKRCQAVSRRADAMLVRLAKPAAPVVKSVALI